MFGKGMKRGIDLTIAFIGVVVFFPLLLVMYLLVMVVMGWPPIFSQTRPGYKGFPFKIYKFRTMNNRRDDSGVLLPDEVRLTKFGRFLRSTSLDELPELFNVLKGDMSLVGPRPLLTRYLERYSPEQFRRHEVKPGITGWAQVNGRNAVSWEDKFYMDVWYIDNWSLWLDIKILALTVIKVFTRSGISAENYATMPEFTGSLMNEPLNYPPSVQGFEEAAPSNDNN